jgi:hypothetical protein
VSGNRPAKIFRQNLPSRRAPSPNRLAAATISVSVTPQSPPALGPSGTQQFAATVSGSSNQTVTWIVASGLGSVSPTGLSRTLLIACWTVGRGGTAGAAL